MTNCQNCETLNGLNSLRTQHVYLFFIFVIFSFLSSYAQDGGRHSNLKIEEARGKLISQAYSKRKYQRAIS